MQAVPLSKAGCFFTEEIEEEELQVALDNLSLKKLSFSEFRKRVPNPLLASRIATKHSARSLLHLAVYENQLDIIALLKTDPILRLRRDVFGLSPIDLAHFLNRTEAIKHLETFHNSNLPELPKLDDFEYLSSPIFEDKEGMEQVLDTVAKAKQGDIIPEENIWMGVYFDKEIRGQMHPPISIQFIDAEIGFGVFADKKISACSFVGEYTGVIQQRSPKQLKEKKHCLRYTVWEGKKNFAINAETKGNFTRFLNHSSNPNLGLQSVYWRGLPRMIFIALKDIPKGRQLTFDYGPLFWKATKQRPKDL